MATPNIYDYESSVEIPLMSERRVAMLKALHRKDVNGRAALTRLLYDFAREDLQSSVPHNTRTVKAMMKEVLQDEKRRNVQQLLAAMHVDVIEALINNTVGNKYASDPTFPAKCYEKGEVTGVYVNTVLRNDEPKFFTGEELNSVCDFMQRYSDMTHPDESAEIDATSGKPSEPYWMRSESTQLFITMMRSRVPADPEERKIRQIQSPLEVGFATDIQQRLTHYCAANLENCEAPWALFISCLRMMNLNVNIVQAAVLLIWRDDMKALGKILVTMLSQSMVSDGGFNGYLAGISKGKNKEKGYHNMAYTAERKSGSEDLLKAVDEKLKKYEGEGADAVKPAQQIAHWDDVMQKAEDAIEQMRQMKLDELEAEAAKELEEVEKRKAYLQDCLHFLKSYQKHYHGVSDDVEGDEAEDEAEGEEVEADDA